MLLTKNGITYDLTSLTQIEAFKVSGWTEVSGDEVLDKLIEQAGKPLEEAPKARRAVKKAGD
jgi:hypothetical protein